MKIYSLVCEEKLKSGNEEDSWNNILEITNFDELVYKLT